jgi:hypothetical protein
MAKADTDQRVRPLASLVRRDRHYMHKQLTAALELALWLLQLDKTCAHPPSHLSLDKQAKEHGKLAQSENR